VAIQYLSGARDGVGAYYRSRPLLLSLGLPLEQALASSMMRVGGMSEGEVRSNPPASDGGPWRDLGGTDDPRLWEELARWRSRTGAGDKDCVSSIAVALAEMRRPH
jgi:hypothetical protein